MTMASPLPNTAHVVIRVAPRLLGDVLCLTLRDHGLDVELYLDQPESVRIRAKRFDLALITDELPGEVIADTILVLDPSGRKLTVAREGQDRSLTGEDELARLIGIVEGLLGEDLGSG
jgi:hypothetical protein